MTALNPMTAPADRVRPRPAPPIALLAELTEAAQVLTDLGSGDVHSVTQRVGRDTHHALIVQIVQITIVAGQAVNNGIGNFLLFHDLSIVLRKKIEVKPNMGMYQ